MIKVQIYGEKYEIVMMMMAILLMDIIYLSANRAFFSLAYIISLNPLSPLLFG